MMTLHELRQRWISSWDWIERQHILYVVQECKWKRAASAKALGISVKTLYNKLKSYELQEDIAARERMGV